MINPPKVVFDSIEIEDVDLFLERFNEVFLKINKENINMQAAISYFKLKFKEKDFNSENFAFFIENNCKI